MQTGHEHISAKVRFGVAFASPFLSSPSIPIFSISAMFATALLFLKLPRRNANVDSSLNTKGK